jgi:hypothetical protein
MKNKFYILGMVSGLVVLIFLAHTTLAQTGPGGLVPCEGAGCSFRDLLELIRRGLGLVIRLILPIAAIILAYVGFLFLTSGGNEEVRHRAKGILMKVIIGIILILCAGLIVGAIFKAFGTKSCYNWLGKKVDECVTIKK